MLASTILPISSQTLLYGSCDSGCKVHADDEALNEKMEKAAEYLNLRKHITGAHTQTHCGACVYVCMCVCVRCVPDCVERGV